MIDWDTTFKFGGFFFALFAVIYNLFVYNIKLKDDFHKMNQDTNDKIANACLNINKDLIPIASRLTMLETKTELFWKCIESKVVDMITSFPTALEKDHLLQKMLSHHLTLDETTMLKTILEGELKSAEKDKFGYVLILARLEQLIYEKKSQA